MTQPSLPPQRTSQKRFLQIAALVWGGLLVALLLGSALAPHLGHIADVALHQTYYRTWQRVVLHAGHLVDDRSTPVATLQSYYSVLYWGEPQHLESLSGGAFRVQIQARLQAGAAAAGSNTPTYRSYVHSEHQSEQHAVVLEKFHLFWQQGLRFTLQRTDAGWAITQVDLVP